MTDVNDLVQERIAAARARIEANKRRRTAQAAARRVGLTQRYRIKLALLDATETSTPSRNAPDEGTQP